MADNQISVSVSNIGGIDEMERTFEPGVTVISGRNASNRTSLLRAMMAALGSDQASLKADADAGSVELAIGDDLYTRTLTRKDGGVSFGGDPYLGDAEAADLFAFLLETNEARLAVPRGDDLRDIIMRPVDTEAIQAEIRELEQEKREIDSELEVIESKENHLPELRDRLARRQQEIEEKEDELAEKETALDELDQGVEETREEKDELEESLRDLRDARKELQDLQYKLETEEESLDSLQADQADLEEQWDALDTVSESRYENLEEELSRLRKDKQSLEEEVSSLQRVIQFNEEMLEGASEDIANALRGDGGTNSSEAVTDQLVQERAVICWTCGSTVEESAIEETLNRLRSLLSDKHESIRILENEIEDVRSEKQTLESKRQRAEEVSRRRREVADEIDRREESIAALEDQIDEQTARVAELEAAAESMEDDEHGEILEKHKDVNQLQFELDRLRDDVDDIEGEIEELEAEIDEVDGLESRRAAVSEELQELRTKLDRLEQESVEAFNEHMDEILDILAYENIDRIWLEWSEREVRDGRQKTTKSTFDLHVVRSTEDGTSFEDTVAHLSESEREVTGLVFALAGYLVHEVFEDLPVMLLDSLEAIDSDRISNLIEYFEQYTDFLIAALLPEDASVFDDRDDIVDPITT